MCWDEETDSTTHSKTNLENENQENWCSHSYNCCVLLCVVFYRGFTSVHVSTVISVVITTHTYGSIFFFRRFVISLLSSTIFALVRKTKHFAATHCRQKRSWPFSLGPPPNLSYRMLACKIHSTSWQYCTKFCCTTNYAICWNSNITVHRNTLYALFTKQ